MIAVVHDLVSTLQAPFTDAQAAATQAVTTAGDNVSTSLGVTDPPPATSNLQQVLSDFFQPIQDLDLGPEYLVGVGALASILDLSLNQTTDIDGNPALAQFTADKGTIGTEAVDRLTSASSNLGQIEEVLDTDWHKLSTTYHNAGGIWGQSPDVVNSQTTVVSDSTYAWLYEAELPMAYGQVSLPLTGGTTVDGINNFWCLYSDENGNPHYAPFVPGSSVPYDNGYSVSGGRPVPASAVFAPTSINAAGAPFNTLAYVLVNPDDQFFQTPLATLTDPLFSTGKGGLGLNQAEFYTWSWTSQNQTRFGDYMAGQPLASKLSDSHGGSPTTCPGLILTNDSRSHPTSPKRPK